MTVEILFLFESYVFEKIEIFMKRSGEKKQHDCISSRKLFPTPKKFSELDASFVVYWLLYSLRNVVVQMVQMANTPVFIHRASCLKKVYFFHKT